jgi:hypothetical protein
VGLFLGVGLVNYKIIYTFFFGGFFFGGIGKLYVLCCSVVVSVFCIVIYSNKHKL